MAHSGGSLIGIQAAARAPELYSAYIGVAQISYQLKSETLFYEYSLQAYREIGNKQMVRQLEAAPATMTIPLPASYMKVRDKAMHGLGVGTTHGMRSVITGVFLASWLCREYTLGEKLAIWRGKFSNDKLLWDKIIAVDLTREVPRPTCRFTSSMASTITPYLTRLPEHILISCKRRSRVLYV